MPQARARLKQQMAAPGEFNSNDPKVRRVKPIDRTFRNQKPKNVASKGTEGSPVTPVPGARMRPRGGTEVPRYDPPHLDDEGGPRPVTGPDYGTQGPRRDDYPDQMARRRRPQPRLPRGPADKVLAGKETFEEHFENALSRRMGDERSRRQQKMGTPEAMAGTKQGGAGRDGGLSINRTDLQVPTTTGPTREEMDAGYGAGVEGEGKAWWAWNQKGGDGLWYQWNPEKGSWHISTVDNTGQDYGYHDILKDFYGGGRKGPGRGRDRWNPTAQEDFDRFKPDKITGQDTSDIGTPPDPGFEGQEAPRPGPGPQEQPRQGGRYEFGEPLSVGGQTYTGEWAGDRNPRTLDYERWVFIDQNGNRIDYNDPGYGDLMRAHRDRQMGGDWKKPPPEWNPPRRPDPRGGEIAQMMKDMLANPSLRQDREFMKRFLDLLQGPIT